MKPTEERNHIHKAQYALLGASVITGIIGFVWVTTLPAQFGDGIALDSESVNKIQQSSTDEDSGFGSFIKDTASQLGSLIQTDLDELDAPIEEDTSALGSLGNEASLSENQDMGGVSTSTPVYTEAATSSPNDVTPEVPKESENTQPEVQKTEPPRVILIGTTTGQKAE